MSLFRRSLLWRADLKGHIKVEGAVKGERKEDLGRREGLCFVPPSGGAPTSTRVCELHGVAGSWFQNWCPMTFG